MAKLIVIAILVFIAGMIFQKMMGIAAENRPKPMDGGALVIRKNEEAIDGQIRFTRDLWELSTAEEVIFKVKIIPGEPGEK